jgi:hypothetical protein
MVLVDPECLQHDFAEKHTKHIDQFRVMHPFCVSTLLALGLNIIGMYKAICLIRAFTKKNGNQLLALLRLTKESDTSWRKSPNHLLSNLLKHTE